MKFKVDKRTADELERLGKEIDELEHAIIDEKGREVLSSARFDLDTSLRRPLTLNERIKRLIHTSISDQAAQQGHETVEEAMDFDMPEEREDAFGPGYELEEMIDEYPIPNKTETAESGPQDSKDPEPAPEKDPEPAGPPAENEAES